MATGEGITNLTSLDLSGNLTVAGTEAITGGVTFAGSVTLGDASTDILTVPSTTIFRATVGVNQGAPTAKTVSATLTAANLLTSIITVNQGAGATSAQQLPLATAMDTALASFVAGDAFNFSVINISTVDAEDASITINTGWTLVGKMDVLANNAAATGNTSGLFRARKTAAGAWTLYRLA